MTVLVGARLARDEVWRRILWASFVESVNRSFVHTAAVSFVSASRFLSVFRLHSIVGRATVFSGTPTVRDSPFIAGTRKGRRAS